MISISQDRVLLDRLWDNFIDIGLQGAYIKSNPFIRYYLMQETGYQCL
jgi:hypothetical protein